MVNAKKLGGRPTKFKVSMLEDVIVCGSQGMGMAEIAVSIGISRETLNTWRHENKAFSDAINAAKLNSQAWWERVGRTATVGEIQGFSAVSYIFQMKNRFPDDWRDTSRTELTGKNGDPIEVGATIDVQKLSTETLIDLRNAAIQSD